MKFDKVILVIMALVVAVLCFAQITLAPQSMEPAIQANVIQSIASDNSDLQTSLLSIGAGNFLIPFILFLLPLGAGYVFYLKKNNNLGK